MLYDSFADGQTQAAAAGLGGEVGGEDLVLVLFGDARAVVFNYNVVEAVFVGIADGYQQAARGVHVFHRLDGVGDKVHHHAGELRARCVHKGAFQAEVFYLNIIP